MKGRSKNMDARARPPTELEGWCAGFERECRSRGIRITPQRLAVYRAVAGDLTHPTAESVHSRLRPGMTSLSVATVYRTLEFLQSQGLVRRVSTTESVSRFDANVTPHHHLVCRGCGKIRDWESDSFSYAPPVRQRAGGFLGEALEMRLVGLCEGCRRARPLGNREEVTESNNTARESSAPRISRRKHNG